MRGLLRERERKNLVRVSGLVVKVREREIKIRNQHQYLMICGEFRGGVSFVQEYRQWCAKLS